MNHSGVLGALLQFLTGGESNAECTEEGENEGRNIAQEMAECEERLRLFLHVFADMPLTSE